MLVHGVSSSACRRGDRGSVGETPFSGHAFLDGELRGRGAMRTGAGPSLSEKRVQGGRETTRGIVEVVGELRLWGEKGHAGRRDGCYR